MGGSHALRAVATGSNPGAAGFAFRGKTVFSGLPSRLGPGAGGSKSGTKGNSQRADRFVVGNRIVHLSARLALRTNISLQDSVDPSPVSPVCHHSTVLTDVGCVMTRQLFQCQGMYGRVFGMMYPSLNVCAPGGGWAFRGWSPARPTTPTANSRMVVRPGGGRARMTCSAGRCTYRMQLPASVTKSVAGCRAYQYLILVSYLIACHEPKHANPPSVC